MNHTEIVFSTLKKEGKALKAGEIAEKCGLDKKEVDKAMKQLKEDERIFSPKRCFRSPK